MREIHRRSEEQSIASVKSQVSSWNRSAMELKNTLSKQTVKRSNDFFLNLEMVIVFSLSLSHVLTLTYGKIL